jgi:hypothetical protein
VTISKDRDHNPNFYHCLMMEAARTAETSVDNYFALQYTLEDKTELHTRRRDNLKSHTFLPPAPP